MKKTGLVLAIFILFILSVIGNIALAAGNPSSENYFGFMATASNGSAVITWTTDDVNTAHFVVEHSVDGTTFVGVCEIAADKGSINYSYIHAAAKFNAVNYYRLKQVNTNGVAVYSHVRVVRFDDGNTTEIKATEIIRDVLEITILKADVNVKVTGIGGKMILKKKLHPGKYKFNTAAWDSGAYQLSVYRKGKLVDKKQVLKF